MRKLKIQMTMLGLLVMLAWPMNTTAQKMTDEQVQNEMLAKFNAIPLQAIHNWRGDGIWIRRNNLPVAYMKQNKMEKQWKLKSGAMSKTAFLSGTETITRLDGEVEHVFGSIQKNFNFFHFFIGGTLIGKVYFDGRMFDGKGHPCGRIQGPVDDDMVVFIYYVYSMGEN